jgi:hypothetical protein
VVIAVPDVDLFWEDKRDVAEVVWDDNYSLEYHIEMLQQQAEHLICISDIYILKEEI